MAGKNFSVGESAIENNPPLRNEVRPEFNGSRTLALSHAKITGRSLKEKDDKFPGGRLFADIEDGVDVEILDDMMIVVQDKDSYFVIPAAADDDDSIDLEECGKNERKPPKGNKISNTHRWGQTHRGFRDNHWSRHLEIGWEEFR